MENTISQNEYVKTRLGDARRIRESQEQIGGESLVEKSLDPLGEKFPFQCSCGAKHQFLYIENEAGLRLLRLE